MSSLPKELIDTRATHVNSTAALFPRETTHAQQNARAETASAYFSNAQRQRQILARRGLCFRPSARWSELSNHAIASFAELARRNTTSATNRRFTVAKAERIETPRTTVGRKPAWIGDLTVRSDIRDFGTVVNKMVMRRRHLTPAYTLAAEPAGAKAVLKMLMTLLTSVSGAFDT
jgi:hypothetical protein